MWLRRILCLLIQLGCVVFYILYKEWMSWILLLVAVGLPWLSLLLSLPAILSCRAAVSAPAFAMHRQFCTGKCIPRCPLPTPPFKGRLLVRHGYSGETEKCHNDQRLPTYHCGRLELTPDKVRIDDYLQLFRFPVLRRRKGYLLVRPHPLPMPEPPDLSRYLASRWRPKPGGGYSENHELRLYRPGDSLRQIHWKLSAKTGQLILREPMEAIRGLAIITLELNGEPDLLDKKLGRLLWVSQYLLEQQVSHTICCLTGTGLASYPIANETNIQNAIDALLGASVAPYDARADYPHAAWRHHIGGESFADT